MYHLLIQVDIAPEHREEFIAVIQAHGTDCLQAEPGTLVFDIIQDDAHPNRIFLHEGYADEAAFQAHEQGEIGQRNKPRITALVGETGTFLGKGLSIGPSDS